MRKICNITAAAAGLFALLAPVLGGAPTAAQTASDVGYRIGRRDLIEIKVFEEPNLNGSYRVTEEGTIEFFPVGKILVEGKTAAGVAAEIEKRLEDQYLQRASVDVELTEFRSRPISIVGAVAKPGDLPFSGRLTLIEALTEAGGLGPAHGRSIQVLRRAENGLTDHIEIGVEDLFVRADPKANIPIFANDLITVPMQVDVTIYCLGEVRTPGAMKFTSSERATVLAAIARAGGLTDRASRKILVKRTLRDGSAQEQTVDYKRIVAGRETDLELQEGDILVVKESFF